MEVKRTPQGLRVEVAGHLVLTPVHLVSLPALLHGPDLFVGKEVILEHLKKLGHLNEKVAV
jgi:hypothetical protein